MKITITHSQETIDPSATVSDADFPRIINALEKQYRDAIADQWPSAAVDFVRATPAGNGVRVIGAEDYNTEFDVVRTLEQVYETGLFW